jgi:sugar lactone lactonase YvrE
MSNVHVFDDRACVLGEGPLWHPERQQLYWFDILRKSLMTRVGDQAEEWQFDDHVSAAGWIDADHLLIASAAGLFTYDLTNGQQKQIVALEEDGRADPLGGLWIGTMGKSAEPDAGAIYRFYKGELRLLYKGISVSNAICFTPDGNAAYFTDTHSRKVMRQTLDAQGWPKGTPELFLDVTKEGLNPDGAVVDAQGCFWNAQWGASRVARYDPAGNFLSEITFPARQVTCPAFGGPDLSTLYVTSASVRVNDPQGGQTFAVQTGIKGQKEHQIIL